MLSTSSTGFRYFIELAFNGTSFHGWQIQPGAETVQETLNHALGILTGEQVNLVGCGRTDAGVHASHFVAHFEVNASLNDCVSLTDKLNRFLKKQIRVDRIVSVTPDSHARFHAKSRTYQYLISKSKSPFISDYSWNFNIPLDVQAMNEACSIIIGKHDFTSFSKLHTDVKTNDCEVYDAFWIEKKELLIFKIRSDRFLRNMVRAIVGTMIEVGKGKIRPADVNGILMEKDRSKAGMSVPAKGLFLTKVEYDPDVFEIAPKAPFPNWF